MFVSGIADIVGTAEAVPWVRWSLDTMQAGMQDLRLLAMQHVRQGFKERHSASHAWEVTMQIHLQRVVAQMRPGCRNAHGRSAACTSSTTASRPRITSRFTCAAYSSCRRCVNTPGLPSPICRPSTCNTGICAGNVPVQKACDQRQTLPGAR